jgi:predicted outer membrane protein
MPALLRLRIGLAAAGLVCLAIGNVSGQQTIQRPGEQDSGTLETQDRANDRPGLGQIDRTQQGEQHSAQFRGTQSTADSQDDQVATFIAACLLAKNEAEVELGQFAQQQSQNPEVKQFAQQMVKDHGQLVQKLQPLAGSQAGQGGQSSTSPSLDSRRQLEGQQQASDTTRLPGSPGAGQPAPGASATGQAARSSLSKSSGKQNQAIKQLMSIDRQITERHSQAVREALQEKQGAEFDQAYVGSQVAGHMHMLAALEVIEQEGPDKLRQIAQQARPTVEQHLQHAKQLKEQLKGQTAGADSQAERQSTRTQR